MSGLVTAFLWVAWAAVVVVGLLAFVVAVWAVHDCLVRRRESWHRSDYREMRAYQRAHAATSQEVK